MNRLSQELLPQCNKHNKRLLKDRVFYPNRFARAKIILHKLCLKVNALLGEQKLSPYQEPTPYLNPLPNPTPDAEARVGMFVVQETSEVFTGRWEGKAWFFFLFQVDVIGQTQEPDKRWSCCRGQSDSTNYDTDFVRETGCFKNSLNTMTCGTAREINSNLCGFFY